MSWSLVQNKKHTTGAGGNPTVGAGDGLVATTAGNLLVAVVGGSSSGGTSSSFTMPAGWTVLNSGTLYNPFGGTSKAIIGFAYYWNNPGSITSVTATFNDAGGNTSGWLEIQEWSGELTGSDPYDTTAGLVNANIAGAGSALTASLTPTVAGELVIAAFTTNESSTTDWGADAGWTQDEVFHFTGYNTAVVVQHIVDSGTTTESPSINVPTGGVASVLGIIAFQPPVTSQTVNPTGIASGEAFGTLVAGSNKLQPTGIASSEAFGATVVQAGRVHPTGIPSGEAFGANDENNTFFIGYPGVVLDLRPPSPGSNPDGFGIPSSVAFGTPLVLRDSVIAGGIPSGEAFGSLRTNPAGIGANGIASSEAFGAFELNRNVKPTGIASGEAFGAPAIIRRNVSPTGIPSGEAFGSSHINPFLIEPLSVGKVLQYYQPALPLGTPAGTSVDMWAMMGASFASGVDKAAALQTKTYNILATSWRDVAFDAPTSPGSLVLMAVALQEDVISSGPGAPDILVDGTWVDLWSGFAGAKPGPPDGLVWESDGTNKLSLRLFYQTNIAGGTTMETRIFPADGTVPGISVLLAEFPNISALPNVRTGSQGKTANATVGFGKVPTQDLVFSSCAVVDPTFTVGSFDVSGWGTPNHELQIAAGGLLGDGRGQYAFKNNVPTGTKSVRIVTNAVLEAVLVVELANAGGLDTFSMQTLADSDIYASWACYSVYNKISILTPSVRAPTLAPFFAAVPCVAGAQYANDVLLFPDHSGAPWTRDHLQSRDIAKKAFPYQLAKGIFTPLNIHELRIQPNFTADCGPPTAVGHAESFHTVSSASGKSISVVQYATVAPVVTPEGIGTVILNTPTLPGSGLFVYYFIDFSISGNPNPAQTIGSAT